MTINTLKSVDHLSTLSSIELYQGTITSVNNHNEFIIDHYYKARQSLSCVLKPELEDTVLFIIDGENRNYVLHILDREDHSKADLQLPNCQTLNIKGRRLHIIAEQEMSIISLGPLNIDALKTLQLNCENYCCRAAASLIQLCKDAIIRTDTHFVEAKKLLSMHGKHQLITAEEDMKIDANRINMG